MLDPSTAGAARLQLDLARVPVETLWRTRAYERSARDELLRRYLPLARKLATRYRNAHEPFDDLVQVANLGLLHAIDRYDPERGAPFVSFATPTILGELKRHFRNTGWAVHVPRAAQELAQRVQWAVGEFTDQHGRSPEVAELAQFLELDVEKVLEGLESAQAHYSDSLDAPIADGAPEPTPLGETLGSVDAGYALVEMASALSGGIEQLPHLERTALTLRMQGDLKQSEIATLMGCSQMQVSRLLRRATDRLDDHLGDH
ncbi:MAG: SigB/SigF/SigG family RNA polymerase sigma factor [Solirubrobacteraceae bacterium]